MVPLLASEPLHAPEPVQLVASVELHVRVADAPLSTVVGEALSVAVGMGELEPPPPPQPVRAIATLLPNRSIENRMIPQIVLCRSDAAGLTTSYGRDNAHGGEPWARSITYDLAGRCARKNAHYVTKCR